MSKLFWSMIRREGFLTVRQFGESPTTKKLLDELVTERKPQEKRRSRKKNYPCPKEKR